MVAPVCSRSLKVAVLLVSALASGPALAQKGPPPQTRVKNAPDASVSAAARARSKARADDCAGALPLFDEAIRVTIEPTLRRDRGACHDKLGNAAAAVEDYRAYLYARPEAGDAKTVEERIQVLSGQVEGKQPEEEKGGGASASASISINGNKSEARAGSGSEDADKPQTASGSSYDDYAARVKRRDEAEASPLRTGTGGAFGFYLGVRGFPSKVLSSNVGYIVGVSPRYAFTSYFSLVGELGFAAFGTNPREAMGGLGLWVGAEFRLKLDAYGSNSLLFGAGPGYERYAGLDRATTSVFNTGHLRGRLGFRHVFGANIGLDLSFDPAVVLFDYAGPTVVATGATGPAVNVTPSVDPQLMLGGNLALVVGF